MPDSDGAVMRRTVRVPGLYEFARPQGKSVTAIGVAAFENWPGHTFAFRDQEAEAGLRILHRRQQGDRAVLDRHLNRKPGAYLAVVHLERANLDPVLRN